MQTACFLGLLLLLAAACGGSTLTEADGGVLAEAGAEADASAPDAASEDPNLPVECIGTTPFDAEACGTALSERCRMLVTERDCTSAPPLDLGHGYVCGWAKVTTFSDAATCAIGSVTGRCEAYLTLDGPCPCDATPSTSEIVQSPCGLRGGIMGPVDRYSSLEVQEKEPRVKFACGPQYVPAEPELCKCLAECR